MSKEGLLHDKKYEIQEWYIEGAKGKPLAILS